MRGRIHTLQNEIQTVEDMLDSLSGPMLELALEELRNLQFERDLLSRSAHKSDDTLTVNATHLEEHADHAY